MSAAHSTHAPDVEKDSPTIHDLSETDKSKAVLVLLFAVKYAALEGFVESIPVVENERPKRKG